MITNFTFFQSIRLFELVLAAIIPFIIPFFLRKFLLPLILLFTVLAGVAGFIIESQGRLLFSDDHPSFFYRLTQLKENFPLIPFYNPLWNGGVEAREFFPSGVLNLFFLVSPFLYVFPVENIYNFLVVGLLFLFVPAAAFLATRFTSFSRQGILIFSLLSLCSSLFWYRWALVYGTLGFIVSSSVTPLVVLLFIRCIDEKQPGTFLEYLLFVIVTTLFLFWSPSAFLLLPFLPMLFLRWKILVRKPGLIVALIMLGVINLPWLILFFSVSNIFDFVSHIGTPVELSAKKIMSLSFSEHFGKYWEYLQSLNPLILGLFVPGFISLKEQVWGRSYLLVFVWSLILGIVGPFLKPQLELDRFLIISALLAALPSAFTCSKLITHWSSRSAGKLFHTSFRQVVGYILASLLLLLPLFLWRVVRNKTVERYYFADDTVDKIVAALQQTEGDGRILFAGFILHELSGGHVAPLPYLTGRPLVASRYQHDRWQYTDVIPENFRKRKDTGITEYFNLMNVSHIVTHEPFWRKWFGIRKNEYELIWRYDNFSIFKRLYSTSSYFLEGEGRVLNQTGSAVHLEVESPEAVIKFNYYPYLQSTNCRLAAAPITGQVTFIKLTECNSSKKIVITSKSPVSRLREQFF